jgi:nucleotide-binding universal stress UspA family protein
MTVLVWLAETTWEACVAAGTEAARPGEKILLAHVTPAQLHGAAEGAFGALFGRRRYGRDPADLIDQLATRSARELLAAATERIGSRSGPVATVELRGHVEREIVHLAADARLLVCGRAGDLRRLGPPSLGPATRFVVDHAPCAVLLVWPAPAPGLETLPPPPGHHPPDHDPPEHDPPDHDPPDHDPRRPEGPPRPDR